MDKPKITYGRTAYVQTPQNLLDELESSLGGWAEGQENLCVEHENLIEWLNNENEESEGSSKDLTDFVQAVVDGIEGEIGDIVFHK